MPKLNKFVSILWIASGSIALSDMPVDACSVRREYPWGDYYWYCRNVGERLYTGATGCPSDMRYRDCLQMQREVAEENLNKLRRRNNQTDSGGSGGNGVILREVSPLPAYHPNMRRMKPNQRKY